MFVNCSNHNSKNWSIEQLTAAQKWGEIVDYPFPSVDAYASEEQILNLAEEILSKLLEMKPDAVMCQGEFTLVYALVNKLKEQGIPVVAACSERKTVEEKLPDGSITKTSVFEFVKFRHYQ